VSDLANTTSVPSSRRLILRLPMWTTSRKRLSKKIAQSGSKRPHFSWNPRA